MRNITQNIYSTNDIMKSIPLFHWLVSTLQLHLEFVYNGQKYDCLPCLDEIWISPDTALIFRNTYHISSEALAAFPENRIVCFSAFFFFLQFDGMNYSVLDCTSFERRWHHSKIVVHSIAQGSSPFKRRIISASFNAVDERTSSSDCFPVLPVLKLQR